MVVLGVIHIVFNPVYKSWSLKIEFDSDLNIRYMDEGSDPMISVPKVNLVKTKEPSIVDIF